MGWIGASRLQAIRARGFAFAIQVRGLGRLEVGSMADQLLAELESLILAQNERWRQA